MQLIDKGYYDYDYEIVQKTITYEDTVKDEQATLKMVHSFGISTKQPMDIEKVQKDIIEQLKTE